MHTVAVGSALIVDGLALSVTSQDLRHAFAPFGSVVWTRVAVDRFRRSLGYGYVVMGSEAAAAQAIDSLKGKTIAGLPITVAHTTIPPLPRRA